MSLSPILKSTWILALLGLFLSPSITAWSAETQQSMDDIEDLFMDADLVVQGHVSELRQGLEETEVQFKVDHVYKGALENNTIRVRHGGGKFIVKPEEPSFASYDKAFLFLKEGEGFYTCLRGSKGKKTIINDNVYIDPNNSFATPRLKKYQAALRKLSKKPV